MQLSNTVPLLEQLQFLLRDKEPNTEKALDKLNDIKIVMQKWPIYSNLLNDMNEKFNKVQGAYISANSKIKKNQFLGAQASSYILKISSTFQVYFNNFSPNM